EQHLPLVRRPPGRALEGRVAGRPLHPRILRVQEGRARTGQGRREQVTAVREVSAWLHRGSPWYSIRRCGPAADGSRPPPLPVSHTLERQAGHPAPYGNDVMVREAVKLVARPPRRPVTPGRRPGRRR